MDYSPTKGVENVTLIERRMALDMTQSEVAKKLDVDQSTVSGWESGRTKPVAKHRRKLCELYGCSIEELIGPESKGEEQTDDA